jgi:pimeloyl-ACP methyl ester carboxylesterase
MAVTARGGLNLYIMETGSSENMDRTTYGEHFGLPTPKGYLTASLHFPPGKDRFQKKDGKELIVMLHGFSGSRYEANGLFEKSAGHFAYNGYYVLRFDFRGCGDSHGSMMDVYPSAQMEDAFWAIEYAVALMELKGLKALHLIGFSFGGVVASLCAPANPGMFDSLTLWEAPYNLGRELKRNFEPIDYEQLWERGYMPLGDTALNAQLFRELDEIDVGASMKGYPGPILLVSGTADDIVPFQPNHDEWLKNLRKDNVSDAVIQGADHGFTGDQQLHDLLEVTTGFLKRHKPVLAG